MLCEGKQRECGTLERSESMKREVKHLRDAVNTIQIKEAMQKEIIQNVKIHTKKKKYSLSHVAAAVVLIAILSGALSIPVRAFVNSFIQERMEKVPEEELTEMVDELSTQEAGIDSFSREFTEEEKRKMTELVPKYTEGTFPEGELARAESVEEAAGLGFCFLAPSSTFYLPDRELTDEELLQIIDFYVKRDYAVTKQYEEEFADELAQRKENEEQKIAEIIEGDGIAEEEAVEIAKGWLMKLYGINEDGLECNHYLGEDDVPIVGKTEFYHVNWTDFLNRQYYYFYIDTEDGSLAYAKGTSGNMEEQTHAVTEANALLPELEQSAIRFAEQLQLTYEDCYYAYYSVDDALGKNVMFIFAREDSSAFGLTYYWNGTFYGFSKTQFSTYQEKYEALKVSAEKVEGYTHKEEEIEINIFFEKMEN